jgi:transcriptional regulator of aromatic amino acid metabolism
MTTIATPNLGQSAGTGFVYGQAATVRSLNAMVAEIAKTDIPVLLVGESGTGKEVYARLIHRLSGLAEALLKKVACAPLKAGRLLGEMREGFHPGRCNGDGADRIFRSCARLACRMATNIAFIAWPSPTSLTGRRQSSAVAHFLST